MSSLFLGVFVGIGVIDESIYAIASRHESVQTEPHFFTAAWDSKMNASILKYLKANGEQLDAEISQALSIPMAQLTSLVADLSASGDVICCKVTRYIDGKMIEGTSCRLSCDLPAPARGRKPGVKKEADSDQLPE